MNASDWTVAGREHARYWDELAGDYQSHTRISLDDFHYGPLLPGDRELGLLPTHLTGVRCLELACGAGQNSIHLASRGAETVALDISAEQLEHGRRLAASREVEMEFLLGDMDRLSGGIGTFDLIHSAYGVPFSSNPEQLVKTCAGMLRPGGTLLISLGHPVYAGEWLDVDDEEGIFLRDYFHPVPDVREADDEASVQAMAYPVSECVRWITAADLTLRDLREPAALSVDQMTDDERSRRVPYDSPDWAEQVRELQRFPIVLILKATRDMAG